MGVSTGASRGGVTVREGATDVVADTTGGPPSKSNKFLVLPAGADGVVRGVEKGTRAGADGVVRGVAEGTRAGSPNTSASKACESKSTIKQKLKLSNKICVYENKKYKQKTKNRRPTNNYFFYIQQKSQMSAAAKGRRAPLVLIHLTW